MRERSFRPRSPTCSADGGTFLRSRCMPYIRRDSPVGAGAKERAGLGSSAQGLGRGLRAALSSAGPEARHDLHGASRKVGRQARSPIASPQAWRRGLDFQCFQLRLTASSPTIARLSVHFGQQRQRGLTWRSSRPATAGRRLSSTLGRMNDAPSSADFGFTYRSRKRGEVHVLHRGHLAATLRGTNAQEFLVEVSSCSSADAQHLMARVTGNYKRGNERLAGSHPRSRP